jgi:hypothetical protein
MATTNDLAKLNSIHYLVDRHGTGKAGIKKVNKKLEGSGYELGKLKRGVATFKNTENGANVITVKGTDIKNKKDLVSDIKLGLGFSGLDKQFKGRTKQIKQIYKETDGPKYITGHSLGSSIVTSALVKSKSIRDNTEKAELFNTGYTKAFHDELSKNLTKDDKKELNNKILHHHVKNDVISTSLTDKRIGKLKKYNNDSINPLNKHSLSSFIDGEDNDKEELADE